MDPQWHLLLLQCLNLTVNGQSCNHFPIRSWSPATPPGKRTMGATFKVLNVNGNAIKLFEKLIRIYLCDLAVGKVFSDMI